MIQQESKPLPVVDVSRVEPRSTFSSALTQTSDSSSSFSSHVRMISPRELIEGKRMYSFECFSDEGLSLGRGSFYVQYSSPPEKDFLKK